MQEGKVVISVAKRLVPSAVRRNTVKRIVRESWRAALREAGRGRVISEFLQQESRSGSAGQFLQRQRAANRRAASQAGARVPGATQTLPGRGREVQVETCHACKARDARIERTGCKAGKAELGDGQAKPARGRRPAVFRLPAGEACAGAAKAMKPLAALHPARLLIGVVRLYRLTISPVLAPSCRYWPSCSEYAIEALRIHGAGRGSWLTAKRLCRCHPWSAGGVDDVPPAGLSNKRWRAYMCDPRRDTSDSPFP